MARVLESKWPRRSREQVPMEFWKADGHGVLEDKCPWSSREQVVTEFWRAGDPKRLELESEGGTQTARAALPYRPCVSAVPGILCKAHFPKLKTQITAASPPAPPGWWRVGYSQTWPTAKTSACLLQIHTGVCVSQYLTGPLGQACGFPQHRLSQKGEKYIWRLINQF